MQQPKANINSIDNLDQFIERLRIKNQLALINTPVSPILEIAAITDLVCKQTAGGKALLFNHPIGSECRLATNLFGSQQRVELAFEIPAIALLTERLTALLEKLSNMQLAKLDRQISELPQFYKYAPLMKENKQLISMSSPDLYAFPFLQSWPDDGLASNRPRYITLPQVFTAMPDGSSPNCGMYRCQIHASKELAICWQPSSGAAKHLEAFRKSGKAMPVAVALGGAPTALFSAMFQLPGDLDEMTFAGFLRNNPINLSACETVPLSAPTGCEMVIEGYLDPAETVLEGPFGNHTGFYSPAAPASLVRVTAIRHKNNAIIPATVVGKAPMEDCWMAKAWERLLLAFLKQLAAEIDDIYFPIEWIFHQSAIISLKQPNCRMVREIAKLLWGTVWFQKAKILIFIDAKTELSRAAWQGINLVDYRFDMIHDETGYRLAVDATGSRTVRNRLVADKAVSEVVKQRWFEYGIEDSSTF